MPVVDHGQRVNVVHRNHKPPNKEQERWTRRKYRIGSNGVQLHVYGNNIKATEADLKVVREHFGTNITDSFRVALRLTAQAIRKGRLSL